MKVLVTGANGFIGKHLIQELNKLNDMHIFKFDKDTNLDLLEEYCSNCDFVFHLAGVDKAINESEYIESNVKFTSKLLNTLKKFQNTCPILFTSSIHATENTPYGISKKTAEDLLLNYRDETKAKVYIFRLPDVFGGRYKPNNNSIIATLCHSISRGREVLLDNPKAMLRLIYVKDLIQDLLLILTEENNQDSNVFCSVKEMNLSLGEIADLIHIFQKCQEYKVNLPFTDPFIKKLYDTFLYFLPK